MRRIDCFQPPLPAELLEKRNFFELYPFDGGGSFINRAIAGSSDDAEITRAIVEQNALADFGTLPELDFAKFERWQTVEKSCWINRMYFVVPLARQYRLTKDEKLAKLLRDVILHYKHTYPAPQSLESARKADADMTYERDYGYNAKGADYDNAICYQWYDFQPGSRIVNLLHAMYFLKDSPSISEADWQEFDDFIFTHAQNIYWIESDETQIQPGNHQALRGTALMLACSYFKDDPRSRVWIPVAEKVCEYHILNDLLEDGMLNDLSPSYHFFETWICRDAVILADREGYKLSQAAHERLNKAFNICRVLRQPDGISTIISDGYPLTLDGFNSALPAGPAIPADFKMEKAKIAIRHDGENFVLFDCSPLLHRLSHFHGGKQAVTLFFGGKPFLADSGCCNYDDPDFWLHYKQPQQHSTLLIDGKGDSVLQGRYTWLAAPVCELSNWNNGVIESTLKSDAPGWENVVWSRKISAAGTLVVLNDKVTAPQEVEMTFVFVLHPDVKVSVSGTTAMLENNGIKVKAVFETVPEIVDGQGYVNFVKLPCKKLLVKFRGQTANTVSRFEQL